MQLKVTVNEPGKEISDFTGSTDSTETLRKDFSLRGYKSVEAACGPEADVALWRLHVVLKLMWLFESLGYP